MADFGIVSLVSAQIVTGRTHQIRVHFAHRGMPLAIDPIYSTTEPLMLSSFKTDYRAKFDKEEPPLIDRLTLHAYQSARFDPAGVFRACAAGLEPNSVPSYLQVVDDIPKTASEKPQERFLLERFAPGAAGVHPRPA